MTFRARDRWSERGYYPGDMVLSEDTRGGIAVTVVDEDTATQDGGRLARTWCECAEDGTEVNPSVFYYEAPDGRHGFGCASCRKIVQTG